jgi:uncharacterized membrane protein
VLPSDILPVENGLENIVAALPLNTLELVQAVAQAAGQGAPISLPVGVNLPGVASATARLKIIEPAQLAVGRAGVDGAGRPRTEAHTSQSLVQLDLSLLPMTLNVLAASVVLNVNLHLYLSLADATATLDRLSCATVNQPFHTATLGVQTAVASLGLGQFDDLSAPHPVPVAGPPLVDTSLTVAGLPAIGLQVTGTAGPVEAGSPENQTWTFEGPFVPQIERPSAANTRHFGTPLAAAVNGALSDLAGSLVLHLDLELPAVGPVLQGVLNTVASTLTGSVVPLVSDALTPVIDGLGASLLNPLLDLLGLSVGTADVTVEAVRVSLPDPFGPGNRPYVELVTH